MISMGLSGYRRDRDRKEGKGSYPDIYEIRLHRMDWYRSIGIGECSLMFNISYRKVGGLRFIRIGYLSFSWCISRKQAAKR